MNALPLALAAAAMLAACHAPDPPAAVKADLARGQASTGAGGAVTGVSDPNPAGAGATTGADTADTAADMNSTPLAGPTPEAAAAPSPTERP